MSARDDILGRVRTALRDRPQPSPAARDYRRAGQARPDGEEQDLARLFAERVADYSARVTNCAPDSAAQVIASLLRAHDARLVGMDAGFPAEWRPVATSDLELIVQADNQLGVSQLDALDAVITTCRCGIAVTGTIVLDHGPGQGRRAFTLVPDVHVVVIRADQLVADVPDAISSVTPTPTQTWISGPSATSDIELERVEGVHGPRTLEVVLVQ